MHPDFIDTLYYGFDRELLTHKHPCALQVWLQPKRWQQWWCRRPRYTFTADLRLSLPAQLPPRSRAPRAPVIPSPQPLALGRPSPQRHALPSVRLQRLEGFVPHWTLHPRCTQFVRHVEHFAGSRRHFRSPTPSQSLHGDTPTDPAPVVSRHGQSGCSDRGDLFI